MSPLTIVRIRRLAREKKYVMTSHALDELYDDALDVRDVENALLTGSIQIRQTDKMTREQKLVIHGDAIDKSKIAVVLKRGFSGRLVVITVYRDEK